MQMKESKEVPNDPDYTLGPSEHVAEERLQDGAYSIGVSHNITGVATVSLDFASETKIRI